MSSFVRKTTATVFASAVIVGGVATAPAQAQQQQNGLVNVMVGDVIIEDAVDLAVAANVAATLCGIDVGPLALGVLGQANAVDRSGNTRTICTTDQGPVRITQD